MKRLAWLSFLVLLSCGKASHSPQSPTANLTESDDEISFEDIQIDIAQASPVLNPAGAISLTNLQPNQKVIQKIVVANNSRETNEITIDSSQLSKIQLSSNCDSELVSRKKCVISLSYSHSNSDIALQVMSENFSINGVSVAVEFSSLDYPLINSGISLNSEMIDFGVVTQATTRRIIVKNNALHDDALSLDSQNLGNFTIEKNSCPVSPLKLRSRKYCYIDIKYSAISNTSQQISSITIENKVVSLKVNQSVAPGIFWTKFMPSNLLDEGTQGGLRANAVTSWSNGAYGPAINGDFVLEYDITAVAIGGGVGDIMIGFHSIFPLIGVYPNHQIYADRGNDLISYRGFEQSFSNSILVGDNWTITYQRIGVVITWTVVLPQGTFTGIVSSNLSGPIYPYIIAYSSGTRINSATLSQ